MGIEVEKPEGGIAEKLGDATFPMVLDLGAIERFEAKHGSIFALWDGTFRDVNPPTSAAVRDIVALGLVGGGLTDKEADAVVDGLGPAGLNLLRLIVAGLLGAAFEPEIGEKIEADAEDDKKKDQPSTSEG
ncbi:MAG: gene transfer agent family protein [Rhodobacteraceae bacterium]|nr:gene transfer agent family protein [Paracoccaceae bacterium]